MLGSFGFVRQFLVDSAKVCPSAVALATRSVPRLPPAPARLSTTTGWPSLSLSRCAISLATASVLPPAGKGTTRVMVLLGQSEAKAGRAARQAAAISAMRLFMMNSLGSVIIPSLWRLAKGKSPIFRVAESQEAGSVSFESAWLISLEACCNGVKKLSTALSVVSAEENQVSPSVATTWSSS